MSSTWYSNVPQIGARGCSETRKLVSMRLKNITKKRAKKHADLCKNSPKSGSPKSDCFLVFQGSIPAWSLGCPWGGSQAQKYVKMEAQTWIFYDFRKLFPRDFGDTLEIFPVFHELQIDSTRCSVYGCLCLGLGGKPTVDASQMLPRCLPDASKFPPYPRCVADASPRFHLSKNIW